MKKIILILLFIPTLLFSQTDKSNQFLKLGIYSSSIALNAIGDGLKDSGYKDWGHFCNAASIGVLVTYPFITNNDKTFKSFATSLGSYAFLRFGMFDPIYNSVRGLPIDYIGNTSFYDKALQKMNPQAGLNFARVVSLTVGISLTLNYGK